MPQDDSIAELAQSWRERAAYGWRQRAIWARAQAAFNPEWHLHAVWCEKEADRQEAEA